MAQAGADEAAWRRAVATVLKGASFEDTLETRTPDGTRLAPVYPRKTGAFPIAGRVPATAWTMVQRIDDPGIDGANRQALDDLAGGASGLVLVAEESPFARGFGVSLRTADDLARLFAGIRLDLIVLRFEAGARTLDLARWLGEVEGAHLHYGFDPIGLMATTGEAPARWESMARVLASHRQAGTALTADGRPFHEAGAPAALELACVLSAGLTYLRSLEAGGVRLEEARRCLGFTLAADQTVFATIAKFRALRLLWGHVEAQCGLTPRPIDLHAETAWRMLSRRDPATNILRAGLAAAAAGLAGADSIAALPFTLANGLPDARARRIALNCQNVLLHEANLHRITDPAAGSGGLEAMTQTLCEAAWAHFQDLERRKGVLEALATGYLRTLVESLRAPPDAIVGANKFTLADEAPPAVLRPAPAGVSDPAARALARHRDAEPFEAVL